MDIVEILRHQNPVRLNRDLQRFRKAAQALSADHPRLIDKYPNQWVAVYDGKVAAHASTLPAILAKIKRKRIPQAHTIVRYIEKNKRTMILRGLCSAGGSATQPADRISKP
jgi:hypothetical protein